MSFLEAKLNDGGHKMLDDTAITNFKARLRCEVITPSDSKYDEVRLIWNGLMHNRQPALIVPCTGVADVIEAVNFSREHGLLVAVRGGGHNVSGSATCDGGIMIDLSRMRAVFVDPLHRTARVQGGATWGDVDRETQVFGLAAPGGVVSTTGVAGLTLGGGLGHLRRKYGLTIDNLLSADLVTADGQCLTASATENPELFWGVRGGGGNFGIVTSFEFRLHPVGPMVTYCGLFFETDESQEILGKWRDFMETAPDEFSSLAEFWTVPPVPDFPQELHGKRILIIEGVHCGELEAGERVIQSLEAIGKPLLNISGPMPWVVVQQSFDPFFPKGGRYYYFKSRYLKRLDDATIAAILPRAIHPPSPFILIVLWHYGGAMQRVESSATAFMGRSAPFLMSVDCIWDNPAETDAIIAYARAYLTEMEPYSPGGLYVNFAGFGEEGDKLVRATYGSHYDRLVALKNKYDPTNLFRLNQNIKPTI
jgi:FAD/FMN-containing dehydrogenase